MGGFINKMAACSDYPLPRVRAARNHQACDSAHPGLTLELQIQKISEGGFCVFDEGFRQQPEFLSIRCAVHRLNSILLDTIHSSFASNFAPGICESEQDCSKLCALRPSSSGRCPVVR